MTMKPAIPGATTIKHHWPAVLIGAAFVTLATIYSVVTPPFEAGDESRHYAVVKYMADTARLPVQQPGEAQIHWSHEGNQPPLYYALAAALTFWIDTGDWNDVFRYNPHTTIGDPLRPDNKNITIHPPGEAWPWTGHVLAVHLIRFLSIAMAAVTVATAYAIALSLFRGRRWPAAGAMALTAFNPMFIFISASVNNDNAVIMFVTLALYQLTIINEQLSKKGMGFKYAARLGLLIGLGALSKLYTLGLIPLAGLFFFWLAYRMEQQAPQPTPRSLLLTSRFWRNFLGWSLTMLSVILLVAGWFYLRNAGLYHGDLLALQVMRDTAGQRQQAPALSTLRAEFQGFRIAYWALFGGVNVLADNWIYAVLDWISLAAASGVIAFIIRLTIDDYSPRSEAERDLRLTIDDYSPRSEAEWDLRLTIDDLRFTIYDLRFTLSTFTLLLAWYLIMMAGFIGWNLTQPAGQGRLLYPAIAAISPLGMLGLTWWLPRPAQRMVIGLCTLGLFAFASLAPFRYIAPAYARPPTLTQAELPADLQPVDFTYDGALRLIGYKLHAEAVRPAQTLPLTLYWELIRPTSTDYSIFVHLLGRQRQVLGQLDTYPGGGQWPTSLLQAGDILADDYAIPIPPQAELGQAPTRLLIAAGIYELDEPGRPGKPALDAAGQPVEPIIAQARLIPWQWPDPPRFDPTINFFDQVSLLSYELAADHRTITLNWAAKRSVETDYTVFIQAWNIDANQYTAGFDGPPVLGDYPTSLWAPGEIIVDSHPLNLSVLPPGDYRLLAGLYNPATGERLPAFGPDGPLPDYAVEVGSVQVTGSK
ncbi:MAG: glycosyltransferase family 39 protein [Chloroflexota bacterium]